MISLQEIHESVSKRLGGGGTYFDDAFVRACKRTVADINRQCFLSLTLPNAVDDTYDVDEGSYFQAFDDGVAYYMQLSGEWVIEKNIPDAKLRYKDSLAMAQYHARQDDPPNVGYVP